MVLDVTKDLKWARIKARAPDCIGRDGTYYFHFCAEGKIGVATSKNPTGPFKDALDRPLLQKGGKVRDLWAKRDRAPVSGSFSPEVPFHGAALFRLSPTP